MKTFPHRFATSDDAFEYAAAREGNWAWHVGHYYDGGSVDFFFVTDRMTDFNDDRCNHIGSV